MIISLYKDKWDKTNCRNYRGISLLSVGGKIYAGILIHSNRRETVGLIDDKQKGFREG